MFFTNIFYNLKKLYEYITQPSNRYAEKYSKKWSKYYVDKYISSQAIKISPSPSISSEKYAGSNPPDFEYNDYSIQ